ncbi:MAG: hypothetical protein GF332_00740 [Candidatus Moranbacteria bacterium]|nr:hypothetical protein [Candidatus Moranbacteria bacterium]
MGFFSTTKVSSKDFRGGFHRSEMGKKIRKGTKGMLNRTKQKALYKTLQKRGKQGGGLTRSETKGAIQQLYREKNDRFSPSMAAKLEKPLEDITGYKNLNWGSGSYNKKYSEKTPDSNTEKDRNSSKPGLLDSLLGIGRKKKTQDKNLEDQEDQKAAKSKPGIIHKLFGGKGTKRSTEPGNGKNIQDDEAKPLNNQELEKQINTNDARYFLKNKLGLKDNELQANQDKVWAKSKQTNQETLANIAGLATPLNNQKLKIKKPIMPDQNQNQTDYGVLDSDNQNPSQQNNKLNHQDPIPQATNQPQANLTTNQSGANSAASQPEPSHSLNFNQSSQQPTPQPVMSPPPPSAPPSGAPSSMSGSTGSSQTIDRQTDDLQFKPQASAQEPESDQPRPSQTIPNNIRASAPTTAPTQPAVTPSRQDLNKPEQSLSLSQTQTGQANQTRPISESDKPETEKINQGQEARELKKKPGQDEEQEPSEAKTQNQSKEFKTKAQPQMTKPASNQALKKSSSNKIFTISILILNRQKNAKAVNEIITKHGKLFIGRMGIPLAKRCTDHCSSIITLIAEANQNELDKFINEINQIQEVYLKSTVMPTK